MGNEIETAGAGSLGGWLRLGRSRADIPPGSPCANCGAELRGPWCHDCGQQAVDFHKSIWRLGREVLESFFHIDGRLAFTAPRLILRPGQLTRDYLDGKRAFQVPPLRMFLVVLLLTFLVGQCALPSDAVDLGPQGAELEAARARVMADPDLSEAQKQAVIGVIEGRILFRSDADTSVEAAIETVRQRGSSVPAAADTPPSAMESWLAARVAAVQAEPGRFMMLLGIWAQRVTILALPLSALFLTGLFFRRRDLVVFDHLIFSMHSLTFQLLLITAALAASRLIGPAGWLLLFLAPVHLFVHLRGAYASGVLATLVRMALLFWLSIAAFAALLWLWLYMAMQAMG